MFSSSSDTIAAVATGSGGAISVIRVSGERALEICGRIFEPASGKPFREAKGYSLHYGTITDGGQPVDDVLVSVFRGPRSYTGEDTAEISCHGSAYIRGCIMKLLTDNGARPATAGEFTMRAFMAGKLDLSQAEAVADIIASEDRASHRLAVNQIRGGYSEEFRLLRMELVEIVSLLELELDFSEEDVQFADRDRLLTLIDKLSDKIDKLTDSFSINNAIKQGIPVVIAGEPNTGKSTLLNALLKEDRAMVSDIAGTTRDIIEQSHVIDGVRFRFSDTAGLRQTPDELENMGIERTKTAITRSRILLYLISPSEGEYDLKEAAAGISALPLPDEISLILLANKADTLHGQAPDNKDIENWLVQELTANGITINLCGALLISAKKQEGIDELKRKLSAVVDTRPIAEGETVVTNSRHYGALLRSRDALDRAREGIASDLPSDLLSEDIRDAVYHLGTITGEITNDEILGTIFSKFCIGK